ncbi:MAG TPA: hypothetical protein DIU15_01675, partial [Deltaproteobacteria bacterium]|nr:hypothetical protein [Deltaproteobacteria bacterium]
MFKVIVKMFSSYMLALVVGVALVGMGCDARTDGANGGDSSIDGDTDNDGNNIPGDDDDDGGNNLGDDDDDDDDDD